MSDRYKKNFNKNLSKVFDFSHIRFQKLLVMAQGIIIYAFIALIIAHFIDKFVPDFDPKESKTTTVIWSIIQVVLIVWGGFYIKKIAKLVPVFFYTKDFDIYKGDVEIGGAIAMSLIYVATQPHFLHRIEHLRKILTDLIKNW